MISAKNYCHDAYGSTNTCWAHHVGEPEGRFESCWGSSQQVGSSAAHPLTLCRCHEPEGWGAGCWTGTAAAAAQACPHHAGLSQGLCPVTSHPWAASSHPHTFLISVLISHFFNSKSDTFCKTFSTETRTSVVVRWPRSGNFRFVPSNVDCKKSIYLYLIFIMC